MDLMRITDSIDIDMDKEMWHCHSCGQPIISARESYLKGCLVYEKPGNEVYGKPYRLSKELTISYAPHIDYMRVIEFYCPHCGALLVVKYLPPGHPITLEIQLDIDKLKAERKSQPEEKAEKKDEIKSRV